MAETRILVVDDEESLRFILSKGLSRHGYRIDTAASVTEARQKLSADNYFCAFFDIIMPDGSGLDLLELVTTMTHAPSVVVMTAEATMQNAIAAMKKGAFEYITKPFDLDEVAALVRRIADYRVNLDSVSDKGKTTREPVEGMLIGRAPAMQEVFKLIGKVAGSDATILITGPTGSGKELVARAMHTHSPRAQKPFVTVNCAAIPGELLESVLFGHIKGAFTGAVENQKGKFAQADGGALLLDEIGDMPLELQAKILRALQERVIYPVGAAKPVTLDVRLLAATHCDLETAVAAGNFREDLYHRLNVVQVRLPTLNDRREDIPALVEHFLDKIAITFNEPRKHLSPEAMEALAAADWPGNVRELENAVRRAALLAPGALVSRDNFAGQLPSNAPDGEGLRRHIRSLFEGAETGSIHKRVMTEVERALYREALDRSGWVQAQAARLLGVNRNTLMKKVAELGLGKNAG